MVRIDKSRCIGCGICANACPEGFEVVSGKAEVKNGRVDCVGIAAQRCPRGAIILDDSENKETNEEDEEFSYVRGQGSGMGKGRGMGRGKGFGGSRGKGTGGGKGRR